MRWMATFLSLFNNGFSAQDFPASLVLQHVPELRFKPITRFENACASGSAAVYGARDFLLSGRGRFALVIGVEKMTATPGKEVGDILLKASYQKEEADIPAGFAGVFGRIAEKYFQRYGDQSDALAAIAAKNHKNGVDNPFAQMRKDLGYDFCRNVSEKNPYVAPPLKRTDCSLVSDGAVALIMADEETARAMGKAVRFKAAVQVNDFLPISKRDITGFEGAAQAWAQRPGCRGYQADRPVLRRIARLLHHRRTAGIRGDGSDRARPGRSGGAGRLDREGWAAAGQSVGRVEGEGPSDRRDRRVDARDHRDAAHRPGAGRHAVAEGGSSARCSTWAARRWPTTSRSWSHSLR